jgi:hypothetical protein
MEREDEEARRREDERRWEKNEIKWKKKKRTSKHWRKRCTLFHLTATALSQSKKKFG